VLAALGRADQALALVDEELALARRWGAPLAIGRALRLRGEVRGRAGADDLRAAVDVLGKAPVLLERARAHVSLADALLDVGDDLPDDLEDAMASLFAALDLAETCGADGLRRTVAARLADHGVHVPENVRTVVCLTTTERRIATLAADGVSNREIAEAYFLTPSTVQVTLSSVMERIGVTTRVELRASLEDL
jgi:DNA-binding CsgD family transcriptional regulator